MAFDRFGKTIRTPLALVGVVLGLGACAHSDPRVYALRDPVWRDQDLDNIKLDCKGKDAKASPCIEEYRSYFAWDAADNTIFRPLSEALILKKRGDAQNVNAFDEVPDSSWFTNRIGAHPMTDQEVFDGYCKPGKTLNSDLPDGSWLIDHGKDNGANPGFRVKSDDEKYMLKLDNTDDKQGERATAATAIAARFYHAMGWWAPCDAVVYFRRSLLKLKPGLEIKANVGKPKKFDEKLLDELLSKTSRRGELYRATASRWLPGKPLGPFMYDGTKDDDPSDVIPHEHRRDLRGARVIAAWLNHFDSREQNSMATWMEDETDKSRGHVRHWYIDLGDSFGSEWTLEGFSRRFGHAYMLDVPYVTEDFLSFGIPQRPWDRNYREPTAPIFGFFSEKDFDPDHWRGEYPNPAFQNLAEGDAAWATRIVARFSRSQIEAAVKAGDLTEPAYSDFLVRVLVDRQRTLMLRYFKKLSPVTDVEVTPDQVCAVDLARKTETWPVNSFRYRAAVTRGNEDRGSLVPITVSAEGKLCMAVSSRRPDGGAPDNAESRYAVLRISNGVSERPLEVHMYDLGPKRGLVIAGIARE